MAIILLIEKNKENKGCLMGCRTLKVGRVFGFIGSRRFAIKR